MSLWFRNVFISGKVPIKFLAFCLFLSFCPRDPGSSIPQTASRQTSPVRENSVVRSPSWRKPNSFALHGPGRCERDLHARYCRQRVLYQRPRREAPLSPARCPLLDRSWPQFASRSSTPNPEHHVHDRSEDRTIELWALPRILCSLSLQAPGAT